MTRPAPVIWSWKVRLADAPSKRPAIRSSTRVQSPGWIAASYTSPRNSVSAATGDNSASIPRLLRRNIAKPSAFASIGRRAGLSIFGRGQEREPGMRAIQTAYKRRRRSLARNWAFAALAMAGIGTATGALAQSYKESVLFGFCDQCSKGYEPLSWLYRETTGNLFGITHLGSNSGGTAYELVYDQTKQSYTRQILHGFCTQANCSDGGAPYAGVIADQSGNLYGTASAKGANNGGVIYELYFDQTKQK